MIFFVNILVPVVAGAVYFLMAAEIKRVTRVRKLIFGEIGYNKAFNAFLMFGIYFVTRPLQNILGPHPLPMIVNSLRQFFLMAVIAPSILVGIIHWVPSGDKPVPKSTTIAAYLVGLMMAAVFILLNSIAIDGSKIIASYRGINIYDARWFQSSPVSSKDISSGKRRISREANIPSFGNTANNTPQSAQVVAGECSTVSVGIIDDLKSPAVQEEKKMPAADAGGGGEENFVFPRARLIIIHLIVQFISPVGYFILAAAYVRHRRHNYPLSSVYNLMPKKWRYLEAGLLIFALSMITAGVAAFFGQYYTYLWVIYFFAAIVAGIIELISVKIPPREAPSDLRGK